MYMLLTNREIFKFLFRPFLYTIQLCFSYSFLLFLLFFMALQSSSFFTLSFCYYAHLISSSFFRFTSALTCFRQSKASDFLVIREDWCKLGKGGEIISLLPGSIVLKALEKKMCWVASSAKALLATVGRVLGSLGNLNINYYISILQRFST